jgi:undecaprenyl-diphosphatase
MGSITAYGLLAYLALRVLHRRWLRVGLVALLASLILAIGFSRVYLGAHYLSDVIGGFALGGAWLTACISGIEVARRRARHHHGRHHHHHHPHQQPPSPEAGAAPPG